MMKLFKEEDYPSQTYYGDGAPIEWEVLDEVREAYRALAVPVEWRAGDVMIVDNVLVAHGRAPFQGPREVIVAMSGPMAWSEADVVRPDELG